MNKKGSAGITAFIVILVIAAAGFFVYRGPFQTWKTDTVQDVMKDQLVTRAASVTGLSEGQINDILSVIPEEDQKKAAQIIASHVTPSAIADVTSLIKDRDTAGLVQYAESRLTSEDEEELTRIADNNAAAVGEKLSEYGVNADSLSGILQSVTGQ